MKHTFCTLWLLYFFTGAFAQAPIIDWEKSLGGSDHEYGRKIQQTADGGYIMAGISFSTDGHVTGSHGIYDAWVVKLRADQSIEWQRAFGGSSDDGAYYVEQTADLGFIIGGFTKSDDGDVTQQRGIADTWFIKTDAAGNIIWQKTYGGSDYDVASVIKQTPDGGYIAAGYTKSIDGDISRPAKNGLQDWWLIKLDANGNKQWDKSYGGSDDEVAYSLDLIAGGGYIVSGTTRSTDGQVTNAKGRYDIWTIRLEENGNLLWQKTFGGSGHDNCHAVKPITDGGFLVAGSTQSADGDLSGNEGELDAVLIKYDGAGNLLWHTRLGGNKFDNFSAVLEKNGKYLVVGSTESTTGNTKTRYGKNDVLLLQFSINGTLEWQQQYGGSEIDDAFDLTATNDDGLVMVGSSFSNTNDIRNSIGGGDMWVVKWKTVMPVPVITKQPENTLVCAASVASFTITATLTNSYQWQILTNGTWQNLTDNATYKGSNSARLDIINVQPADANQYRCMLKNMFGETISETVKVMLKQQPAITIVPQNNTVCVGANATFSANGTVAFKYNWQKSSGNNWQNIGENKASFSISSVAMHDAGRYRCVASNDCGSATSNIAALEVVDCRIPNAFSPNGDGINDVWAIYFLLNQPESSVKIFNRDGAQVFESSNGYPTFWNGSHHGKPVPTGVYYYMIAAKSIGQVKGSVTVLR